MKRIISLLIILAMILSITVCFVGCDVIKQSLRGEKGESGVNGKDGIDGKDGVDGKDGADGKVGVSSREELYALLIK